MRSTSPNSVAMLPIFPGIDNFLNRRDSKESSTSFWTQWQVTDPRMWSRKDVLDWIYYIVDKEGLDGAMFQGEAYRDLTGQQLFQMDKSQFLALDLVYGMKIYENFQNLLAQVFPASFPHACLAAPVNYDSCAAPVNYDSCAAAVSNLSSSLRWENCAATPQNQSFNQESINKLAGDRTGVRPTAIETAPEPRGGPTLENEGLLVQQSEEGLTVFISGLEHGYNIGPDLDLPDSPAPNFLIPNHPTLHHKPTQGAATLPRVSPLLASRNPTPPPPFQQQLNPPCPYQSSYTFPSPWSEAASGLDEFRSAPRHRQDSTSSLGSSTTFSISRSNSLSESVPLSEVSSPTLITEPLDNFHLGNNEDSSEVSFMPPVETSQRKDVFFVDDVTVSINDVTKPVKPRSHPSRPPHSPIESLSKSVVAKSGFHLWEFVLELLRDPEMNPKLLKWEDKEAGVFRFVQSEKVARLWGNKKNNPGMTYEKMSRAMRFCRTAGYFESIPKTGRFPKKLCFKFGAKAQGWKD